MQKKEETPNWYRIAGNAGTAFLSTLTVVSLVGVPPSEAWLAAFGTAAIQAGLSICKELSLVGGEAGKALANATLL